ncbi:SCO2522 family protein [Glycomyces luteolus]|uniref:SCO2522 family protein n=1 Tax=Glycomyces luteolus TaxID=2670330 RepID=A0A9X3SPN8_9ACTN|nr:SCO2522 family protein [Glycomyces luteolus]MDA1359141.1 SCO2522 family protein [Glycomyces luteolus]
MTYEEGTAEQHTERFGMSHLSIEVGHLYADDLARPDTLKAEMAAAAAWAHGATEALAKRLGGRRPRVSTCYLVDDYSQQGMPPPEELISVITEAADDAGLRIDYLARESACAAMGPLQLAGLVADRIVFEPPPGENGSRPTVARSGWLCNGVPSPKPRGVAMGVADQWSPPIQNAKRDHSVFLDVELWSETDQGRRWSCPMLAAVWQLLRLGVLRNQGRRIGVPEAVAAVVVDEHGHDPDRPARARFPESWAAMPPILQLEPGASPFPAYRTVSILSVNYLEVEHAVRVICGSVRPEAGAVEVIRKAAEREGMALTEEIVDRLSYIFLGPN